MPNDSDATKDNPPAENQSSSAAAAKGKPDKPGEKDGEVKDGYRWDRAANDWMEYRGEDFSADDARLPYGWEHVGDGSPEKPHQVRQVSRWS